MADDIFKNTLGAYSMGPPTLRALTPGRRPAVDDGTFRKVRSRIVMFTIVNCLLGVGVVGGLAFVAVHFIRKFW